MRFPCNPILICFEVFAYPLKVVSLLQGRQDLKLVMWPIEANGPSGAARTKFLHKTSAGRAQTRKFELYLLLTATDKNVKCDFFAHKIVPNVKIDWGRGRNDISTVGLGFSKVGSCIF